MVSFDIILALNKLSATANYILRTTNVFENKEMRFSPASPVAVRLFSIKPFRI